MSLNYNIIDTLKLLLQLYKYDIFISIIISSILFVIILYINKKKKMQKYVHLLLNIVLIIAIMCYYMGSIFKLEFKGIINNMYVYFLNSIIYLIIASIINLKNNFKKYDYMFYCISLINITFSLFMTSYLKKIDILVIGNIFPIIKFGNIIYFSYYIIKILRRLGDLFGKAKRYEKFINK